MSHPLMMDRVFGRLQASCNTLRMIARRLSLASKKLAGIERLTPAQIKYVETEVSEVADALNDEIHAIANLVAPAACWRIFAISDWVILPDEDNEV